MYDINIWGPWLVITVSLITFVCTTTIPIKIFNRIKASIYQNGDMHSAECMSKNPIALVFRKQNPFWIGSTTMVVGGGIVCNKRQLFIGVKNISDARVKDVNIQVTAGNFPIMSVPFRLPRLDGGEVPFVLDPNEMKLAKLATRENKIGSKNLITLHSENDDIAINHKEITIKIEAFADGANARSKLTLIIDDNGNLGVSPLVIGAYDKDFDVNKLLNLEFGPPTER